MEKNLSKWLESQPDNGRVFAQERLIVAVTECIWEQLEEQQKTKADVAKTLGKSKAYLTQVLNGTRNMTLRTLSDIAFALGVRVDVELHPVRQSDSWHYVRSSSVGSAYRAIESNHFVIARADYEAAANDVVYGSAHPLTRLTSVAEVA